MLVYSIAYTAAGDTCDAARGSIADGTLITRGNPPEQPLIAVTTALSEMATDQTTFSNQPDQVSLTGIFEAVSADLAQGTSRING